MSTCPQEEVYRGQGVTDGTFRGKRHFVCEDNCGMFVALDKLSHDREGNDFTAAPPSGQRYTGQDTVPREPLQKPSHPVTRSAAAAAAAAAAAKKEGQKPGSLTQSRFKVKDRVVVYDKNDRAVHGTVRYVGKYPSPELTGAFVVGVETVSPHMHYYASKFFFLGKKSRAAK